MNYNFLQLDDKEFEFFVVDLLQKVYNKKIDRFKGGKDGGIDGRFFVTKNKEVVIQCKHYIGTGYKGMISKLKEKPKKKLGFGLNEIEKVQKINPSKFVFVTSLPLSLSNKMEIHKLFSPYIKSYDDIFGQENLNQYLSENIDIEKKYYNLWINSSSVLDFIFNNSVLIRSRDELEIIAEKSKFFVKTKNFDEALNRLEKDRVLIITGEPGIGKTILSENLCLLFSSDIYGYEFIDIKDSLKDAENLWKDENKQLYYYDDFLGSNYFEAIINNKDSYIMSFINRVSRFKDKNGNKNKLFLLNSRTNILNYGGNFSTVFKNQNIKKNEYILNIDDLKEYDKGYILYKHIYFSNLSEELKEVFFIDKNYRKIVNHKNFNPRIIQFITDNNKLSLINSKNYLDYINSKLNNPEDIWDDVFNIQSNEYIRYLLLFIVFNGGEIGEEYLKNAYNCIIKNINYDTHISKDFEFMVRLAVGSLVNRYKGTTNIIYTPFNPSLSDYILVRYLNSVECCSIVFISLGTQESLEVLRGFGKLRKTSKNRYAMSKEVYIKVFNNILLADNLYNKDIYYLIDFVYYFPVDEDNENIIRLLKYILTYDDGSNAQKSSNRLFCSVYDYFEVLLDFDFNKLFLKFLPGVIFSDYLEIDNVLRLLDMIEFTVNRDEVLSSVKDGIEEFLIGELEGLAEDIDLSKYISFDEEGDFVYDETEIENAIIDSVYNNYISSFEEIDIYKSLKVRDFSELLYDAGVNVNDLVDIYREDMSNDYKDRLRDKDTNLINNKSYEYINDLDDLFDKN